MKEQILQYFYNNHDNQSTVIAKHFGLKSHFVDKIIESDLSKKANYYKDTFDYEKESIRENKKIMILDEDKNVLGIFESYSAGAKFARIHNTQIAYILRDKDRNTIHHKQQNRTLTYIKL